MYDLRASFALKLVVLLSVTDNMDTMHERRPCSDRAAFTVAYLEGPEEGTLPLCRRPWSDFPSGSWQRVPPRELRVVVNASPWWVAYGNRTPELYATASRKVQQTCWGPQVRNRTILAWDWKPSKCSLIPWSNTVFATTLRRKPVLMVGDSLMKQFFESARFSVGDVFQSESLTYSLSYVLVNISDMAPSTPSRIQQCLNQKKSCSLYARPDLRNDTYRGYVLNQQLETAALPRTCSLRWASLVQGSKRLAGVSTYGEERGAVPWMPTLLAPSYTSPRFRDMAIVTHCLSLHFLRTAQRHGNGFGALLSKLRVIGYQPLAIQSELIVITS